MPYLDLQVYNVAGLIATSLGSTLCKTVYRHPLPRPAPDPLAPYLCVFREKEEFEGTEPGFREFTATVVIEYYMGRQPFGSPLEDCWGALHNVVQLIDKAVIAGRHPSWAANVPLEHLCGIASIEVAEAAFSGGLPENPSANTAYPSVVMRARMIHHETTTIAGEEVLDKIINHFDDENHASMAKTATINAVGPVTATVTPLLSGVSVRFVPGGVAGLVVADRFATYTFVAGVTTYADFASAWSAHATAVLLGTLSGTAGTFGAGYAGETLHLWNHSDVFGFDTIVMTATT